MNLNVRESYGFGRATLLVFGLSLIAMAVIFQASSSGVPSKPRYHLRFELNPNDFWHLSVAGNPLTESDEFMTFAGRGASDEVAVTDERPAILNAVQEDQLDWPHKVQQWDNWEWHRLAQADKVGAKRVLLAQLDANPSSEIFGLTKQINLAYAQRWKQDIVFLEEEQSTMAMLLQFAREHRERYDQVLVLSADAYMVHLEYDISQLLEGQHLVTAKRWNDDDLIHSTRVVESASVWNVHHLLFPRMERAWNQRRVALKDLLKPYNTEVHTHSKVIGDTDQANIRVMPPSSSLEQWIEETRAVCKKQKLDCPK